MNRSSVGYGAWVSPITTELLTADTVNLSSVCIDGEDVYWLEGRPSEGGRNVLVRCASGQAVDITPLPYNVRTRVHEYGGGAYLAQEGMVWFVNFEDQRIYRITPDGQAEPVTAVGPFRYADLIHDRLHRQLICIREDHTEQGVEPTNQIVAIDLDNGAISVLVSGDDFYSNPRLSPAGDRLAWLSWNHPNMPWDSTQLWTAEMTTQGRLLDSTLVYGGSGVSVFQPEWLSEEKLIFVSDPNGWWNLHRWETDSVRPICTMEAEFGLPLWQFGASTYGIDSGGRVVCTYCEGGEWKLARLDVDTGILRLIKAPFTQFDCIRVGRASAIFVGGAPDRPAAVVELNLSTEEITILRPSITMKVGPEYLSTPERVEFPTTDGDSAHGFFYPPHNPDCHAPVSERPPLLVRSHGGPTGASRASMNLGIQFWTSRGFAFLDVNYRGSTGYGRAYRDRLKGRWGVVDVDDCVMGARYLAETGRVDGERLAIRGSSAGGYTTLAALTFRDTFKAGASYYGISDLEALARETHKFESRYLDQLIGPFPKAQATYRERSPIHSVHRLSCPIIFFQGLEDRVVPPSQAEMMAGALRTKGLPVVYLAFEGEQHGFRKADTIKRTLEAELYFYARIFGFEPGDLVEAVVIDNLPASGNPQLIGTRP